MSASDEAAQAKGSPSAFATLTRLPDLGSNAEAHPVNASGTVIGSEMQSGSGLVVPVRWTGTVGSWAAQLLGTGTGNLGSVLGANARGDLAGYVSTKPCTQPISCSHAVVWSADAGTPLVIGRLGSDYNVAKDINSAGEVVGYNASNNGSSVAYIWSASLGARSLPARTSDAGANAVSEVRADETRVAVGVTGTGAAVWVIR